jgi:branched-chain amino acid transport system ATP-binding protein
MLALSRALIEPRRLLLVDEPSKGLAPAIVRNLIDAFAELKAARTTVLLVEQNIHFARELGDNVVVMDDGRVVHAGPMSGFVNDEALQTRLLGLSMGAHT